MKTFISDLFPRLQRFSLKLDTKVLLTSQHWVSIDENGSLKTVFIFRENHELLISKNGRVDKARWEYLGNNSLLMDIDDGSFLLKHEFFDKRVLALKVDSANEYAVFVNEQLFKEGFNSIDHVFNLLTSTYLDSKDKIASIKNDKVAGSKMDDRADQLSSKSTQTILEQDEIVSNRVEVENENRIGHNGENHSSESNESVNVKKRYKTTIKIDKKESYQENKIMILVIITVLSPFIIFIIMQLIGRFG